METIKELTAAEKMLVVEKAKSDTDDWAERLPHDPSAEEVGSYFFNLIACSVIAQRAGSAGPVGAFDCEINLIAGRGWECNGVIYPTIQAMIATAINQHNGSRQEVDMWEPISSAPKDGRTLLLGCLNKLGNWRTMRGQWFSAAAIADEWEDPDEWGEGWYETAVEPDVPNCWAISPTHWQALPTKPGAATLSKPASKRTSDAPSSSCTHPSWKPAPAEQEQCDLCGAIGTEKRYLSIADSVIPQPDSERDAALVTIMACGYEGGTMVDEDLGGKITLHYQSPVDAENAFNAFSVAIDAAMAAQQGEKGGAA